MLKLHKIVMLPTDKATIAKNLKTNKLLLAKDHLTEYFDEDINHKPQYLYILSDEKIKEGDWYISLNIENNPISLLKADINKTNEWCFEPYSNYCKKVIATTDKSLIANVPMIPDSFISLFAKAAGGIKKVQVHYEAYYDYFDSKNKFRLELDPSNWQITPPILKLFWEESDLIELIETFNNDVGIYNRQHETSRMHEAELKKWIDKNI